MRADQGGVALPQAEGVGEVGQRADCCASCQQQGFDGHLLESRERAVAGCAVVLCRRLAACCRKQGSTSGDLPENGTYGRGVYMPNWNELKTPRYPALGAALTLDSAS